MHFLFTLPLLLAGSLDESPEPTVHRVALADLHMGIQERVDALMAAQQEVAFARAAARVGQSFRVLIDDFGREGICPARHAGQAPEVDSIVYVDGAEKDPGDFAEVRCVASKDYDLVARPLGSSLPVIG